MVQAITVKDKNGKPIEGLSADDFAVTEDGEPQQVAFVEFQRFAATATSRGIDSAARRDHPAAAVAAMVPGRISSPAPGDTRYRNRRLLVLYFDLTAMPSTDQTRAFVAAQKYITELMTGDDLVALMSYDGAAVEVKHDFTDDRARLLEGIRDLMFGGGQDLDEIRDSSDVGPAFGQDDVDFKIFNTDRQLSALQTAVSLLAQLPKQKTLLYFTSGIRLNGLDNNAQLRATTNAAIRANVTVNPLDARGLVGEAPLGDATQRSPGGLGIFTGRLGEAAIGNFQRSQDTLYSLAKDTGGTVLFNYNDLSAGIVKAADAVSSYYMLAFYSTHNAKDGRFRRVIVKLNNGIEGELSYRRGYFADKTFDKFTAADKERQLEEALMLENPITEITIAMEINHFKMNRAEYFVPVAVRVPGSELTLDRGRRAARTQIDFIGEVKDDYGATVQNVRDKIEVRLDHQTVAELSRRPIHYETGFTLLPGNYVIKFLVRDAESGRIGTYQTSFTIPNLMREEQRLPISSVVLGTQRSAVKDALFSVKGATQTSHPLVTDGLKLMPSVSRVFSRERDLYVFLQAYRREAAEDGPIIAYVTFFRNGVKVFETSPLTFAGSVSERSDTIPLRLTVALDSLPTGWYDCQITVLQPTSQKAAFWTAPLLIVR